jgi:hypothetical protein
MSPYCRGMDNRAEVREFLTSRRAKITSLEPVSEEHYASPPAAALTSISRPGTTYGVGP